ncbi:MAG TPA: FAD-binding oxidoreductase [Candidatus Methylomirabilis sp.]|nr:FAD-binding oxidoreductase [Candidatus Methylomirabilis sp.]
MPAPSLDQLKSAFRGELIQPTDPNYHSARKVYNGMIDKHPQLIARCVDVADVIAAVNYGRDNGLLTAIRGGGHNGAGLGTCDDGLVIDLSRMKGIRVDPVTKTVRVEGGCVWGDVDHATHAFGMATPCGFISTTGVAGLTLGGGIGYLTRRYGLTIDNLLSADIVLGDGSFVTASRSENADLFWALRGGGGNFGVVTSFEFRLYPVSTVYFGPTFWPLEEAGLVLKAFRDFIQKAPETVSGFFAFLVVPPAPTFPENLHMKKVCGIVWCCTGTAEETDAVTKPIRSLGHPLLDAVGPAPFPVVQSIFDPLFVPGLQWYWRADNFTELSDEAIARHLEHGPKLPSMLSTMHLYPVNGASRRIGKSDTAYSFREALFAEVIVGVDPDPANAPAITNWCKDYWEALHPYSAGGAYVNFMMDEGQDRVQATYRDNYQRLAEIKKKYDPTNFFRVNQNIRPAA